MTDDELQRFLSVVTGILVVLFLASPAPIGFPIGKIKYDKGIGLAKTIVLASIPMIYIAMFFTLLTYRLWAYVFWGM